MMKRMLAVLALLAMLCAAASAAASAGAEVGFGGRFSAVLAARKALETQYGHDFHTLNYFDRQSTKTPDGWEIVWFANEPDMQYVLGEYRVTVDQEGARASWSWDGEDLSAGLEGKAWGAEQLRETWRINRETWNMQGYFEKAVRLQPAGWEPTEYERDSMDPNDSEPDGEQKALEATIGVWEAERIAWEGIVEAFGLEKTEQAYLYAEPDDAWVSDQQIPYARLTLYVQSTDAVADDASHAGLYWVSVKLTDGEVYDITVTDNAIGNG
ncbi:MAG: hypothetical protein IJ240_06650 [Clostridia bacterium]|nr:hypothetical protein [Clostridia bacterium]